MRHLTLAFAWLQLGIGLAIAAGALLGGAALNAVIKDGSSSAAELLVGGAEALDAASKAIEARSVLIDHALSALDLASTEIAQAETLAREQAKAAPQYALGLQAAADLSSKVADTAQLIAVSMNVEIPTGLTREGVKPLWTTSKPFEQSSKKLSETAVQVRTVSTTLSTIAKSVDSGASSMNELISRSGREARTRLIELRGSLAQVSSKEIPDVLAILKKNKENLRVLSSTIAAVQNHGTWVLFGGFLISAWFLLNSLTTMAMASAKHPKSPIPQGPSA